MACVYVKGLAGTAWLAIETRKVMGRRWWGESEGCVFIDSALFSSVWFSLHHTTAYGRNLADAVDTWVFFFPCYVYSFFW